MNIILTIQKNTIYGGYEMAKPVIRDVYPAEMIDFIQFLNMREVRDYLNTNGIQEFRRVEPGWYEAVIVIAPEAVAYLRTAA